MKHLWRAALSLLVLLPTACLADPVLEPCRPVPTPLAVILGTAQDAGLPHIGCQGPHCSAARARQRPERVASLGLRGKSGWWLLDATPDLPEQIHHMGELPRGIFLTHAHIGHYTGLMYLGREALGARGMEVHCSPSMAAFLRSNGPWDQLVSLGQIHLNVFADDRAIELEPGLTLTPIPVPHRDEYSTTHAFLVQNAGAGSLLYLPDIDRWQGWDRKITDYATPGRHLLLDGTFFSPDELPGRNRSEIPHPLVTDTMDLLQSVVDTPPETNPAQVHFIHLNHSNPLWNPTGKEIEEVYARGFDVAWQGRVLGLASSQPKSSAKR